MKKISAYPIAMILGCSILAFGARAEEETSEASQAPYSQRSLESIDESLHRIGNLLEQRSIKIKTKAWTWEELDQFQTTLWRAMALDPARLEAKFIPPQLDPVFLTRELKRDLDKLRKSRHVAEKYDVEETFDEYVSLCEEIIDLREKNLYRKARIMGKKGIIEGLYTKLAGELGDKAQSQVEFSVTWNKADRQELVEEFTDLRSEMNALKSHAGEMRAPASLDDQRLESMKKLLWVLFPLVFLTGLVGGLTWRSSTSIAPSREFDRDHG